MRLLALPSGTLRQSPGLPLVVLFASLLLFAPGTADVARAATIAGTVVDPDGRPVPRARVVIGNTLGAVREVVTGRDGGFEIHDLPGGRYEVHVVADGLQADPTALALRDDERRDLAIALRLSAISESLVVSAAHIDLPRSSSPQVTTVITAADLASRQVESVADALEGVAGLTVNRSGGRGALTSIFPRGGGSNYTLVLVDGVRVNAFGGAYDFAHLSVANVERIEVVRGPQSALYGSEAIGAVVHVITKRGGTPQVDGTVEGGQLGTSRLSLSAAGSRGAWSWGLGTERAASDGFTGRTAAGARVSNDDYMRTQATGSFGYTHPGGTEIVVAGAVSTDERGFPGPWGSDPIGAFPGLDRVSRGTNDTGRLGARVVTPWSASARQHIDVSVADLDSTFTSPFGPSSSGTRRLNLRVEEDVRLARALSVSTGLELVREHGTSSFVRSTTGDEMPIERRSLGAFVEGRLASTDRMLVTGGARLESLTRDPVPPDPVAFPPRPSLARQRVTVINPKLAASVRVHRSASARSATRLRASAGTGIRPPSVFEIAFTDNPDLQPERNFSVDAGVEQQLFGSRLVFEASAFSNRYDDLIVTVGRSLAAASQYRSDNIANARARGVEFTARARLANDLSVSGEYTWLSTAILSVDRLTGTAPTPFSVGDPLVRQPRHQGRIDVIYAGSRVSAFTTWTTRGSILDLEPNFGSFGGLFRTPGYVVGDLGVTVRIQRHLSLLTRVGNVMNRSYEEILGFPALGRTMMVGARLATSR